MRPAPARSPPTASRCSTSARPRRRSPSRTYVRQPRLDDHRVPDGHQGRRAGLGRSDRQRGQQDLDRRDPRPRAPLGRRRDHRERRDPRRLDRRADHRLQRPSQRQGARDRRAQQGRAALLRRHLPPHRLGEGRDGRRARPEIIETSSAAPRSRKSSRRARRTRPPACWSSKASSARAARAPHPRGCHRLEDHHLLAAPVQGRRQGGHRRHGVRRAAGRHQRHQAGRQLEVFEVEERARTL